MTEEAQRRLWHSTPVRVGTWLLLVLCVWFCAPLADGVRRGLSLCAEAVIPSVLPSMLLSDLLLCAVSPTGGRASGRLRPLFGLPPCAAVALLTGLLTGFPMGVRMTVALYQSGALSKEESERLLSFVGNTGPAFLIAGIGAGLYGRIWIGVVLYACQLISAVLIGCLSARKPTARTGRAAMPCVRYSFTESVRTAGEHTVTLCTYVCLFSAVSELLTQLIGSTYWLARILPWLEVSCAAAFLSSCGTWYTTLPLVAFAVGFSGLSVHAQSMAFISKTDLNSRQYWLGKLAQGVLCFLLAGVFCRLTRLLSA